MQKYSDYSHNALVINEATMIKQTERLGFKMFRRFCGHAAAICFGALSVSLLPVMLMPLVRVM